MLCRLAASRSRTVSASSTSYGGEITDPRSPTVAGSKRSPRSGRSVKGRCSVAISASYEPRTDRRHPRAGVSVLKTSDGALCDAYDVAMLDLDGVVYIGQSAVAGAPEHLDRARAAGMQLAYVTNNASRPPTAVAEHLRDLGLDVDDADVVTSAQAAARVLADRLPPGAAVFVIGGEGLEVALGEQGLRPVQERSEQPLAVVSGFSADLRWS